MKEDITLNDLMDKIKQSLLDKKEAENAIYRAEQKKAKAHQNYILLMDTFRAKEYVI